MAFVWVGVWSWPCVVISASPRRSPASDSLNPAGVYLAAYGLHNLSRMIPLGEAMWIQLTGSQMTAQRAYDVGLIQALAPLGMLSSQKQNASPARSKSVRH